MPQKSCNTRNAPAPQYFCTFWSFGPHLRHHLVSVPTHETWGSYDQASISAGRGDVYVRRLRNAWYVVILIIIQYSLEVQLCDAAAAGVGFQKYLYRKTKMSVDVKVLFTAFLPMHSMPSFWHLFRFNVYATDDDDTRWLTSGTTRKSPNSSEFSCVAWRNPERVFGPMCSL